MSVIEEPSDDSPAEQPAAPEVVAFTDRGDGFAYVPRQVLVRGSDVKTRLEKLAKQDTRPLDEGDERGERGWHIAENVDDPLSVIDVLRSEGFDAQPNHVMFAHPCGRSCPPHPAIVQELVQYGFLADPMKANPMKANPMKANPMKANPMKPNPMKPNGGMESSALPAPARRLPERTKGGPWPAPTVIVLDTGLAGVSSTGDLTAPLLRTGMAASGSGAVRISGPIEEPDNALAQAGSTTANAKDGFLDPAAGHGTFIVGVIEQLAPGCTIKVRHVIEPIGSTDEGTVGAAINAIVAEFDAGTLKAPLIISMSFGGQVLEVAGYLREAVARAVAAGIVIVASAGNDGQCAPQYPAAFPNVISVAALGPDGPAPWTNYGDWVDACAPGTDLVSSFFGKFDGKFPSINTVDPDRFAGWAEWSGTSFAVPVVVAAIARELVTGQRFDSATAAFVQLTAKEAAERVVRAPHLTRLPCLGTVINI